MNKLSPKSFIDSVYKLLLNTDWNPYSDRRKRSISRCQFQQHFMSSLFVPKFCTSRLDWNRKGNWQKSCSLNVGEIDSRTQTFQRLKEYLRCDCFHKIPFFWIFLIFSFENNIAIFIYTCTKKEALNLTIFLVSLHFAPFLNNLIVKLCSYMSINAEIHLFTNI